MLLKDLYSKEFYYNFSLVLNEVLNKDLTQELLDKIFNEEWKNKELKQRMKHTTLVLHSYLSKDFKKACEEINQIINLLKQKKITQYSLEFMFFPDYIETYGINDFSTSIKAIEFITQFTSCEFAVRPFIIKYGIEMMQVMQHWSLHASEHVRRLSTEGCRTRLPWGIAIPELKKNPSSILPILENLKHDTSEYVRRSVANNLNDLAKDHSKIVIEIAKKWKGNNKNTDAIIKHGLRTLLKQGNFDVLALYDLNSTNKILLNNFRIESSEVKINEFLSFSFSTKNTSVSSQNIRLEYAIYFLLKNGKQTKKVYKILEKVLLPNEEIEIQRKHNFKLITTRKFYLGEHQIAIILNGIEREKETFTLNN